MKALRFFGDITAKKGVWAFNRRNVSKGIAFGVFSAYIPVPFEMMIATFLVLRYGGNLPLAISIVWVSNPLTWIFIYGPPYKLGAWLLNIEPMDVSQLSVNILGSHYIALWVGCVLFGLFLSIFSYVVAKGVFRIRIARGWSQRQNERKLPKNPQD